MNYKLPPKFDKSAVRSDRLKFHWIWSSDLEFPGPSGASCNPTEVATSDVNAVSSADVSTPIPDISDAVKGKWPLDATDPGLTGISDIDDMVLFGGIIGATSAALFSITILRQGQKQLPLVELISCKMIEIKSSLSNKIWSWTGQYHPSTICSWPM